MGVLAKCATAVPGPGSGLTAAGSRHGLTDKLVAWRPARQVGCGFRECLTRVLDNCGQVAVG